MGTRPVSECVRKTFIIDLLYGHYRPLSKDIPAVQKNGFNVPFPVSGRPPVGDGDDVTLKMDHAQRLRAVMPLG